MDVTGDDKPQDEQEKCSDDKKIDSQPNPKSNTGIKIGKRTLEQILHTVIPKVLVEDFSDNDIDSDEKRIPSAYNQLTSFVQGNLKQKFLALLQKFKISEEELNATQDAELVNTEKTQQEIDALFEELELEDPSDSGTDFDNLSVRSTSEPSLKPYFTEKCSQGDKLDVPKQENLKQKFIALLQRFKILEEVLNTTEDAEFVDSAQNQQEINAVFDELEDPSNSRPEIENLSVHSTSKPSLRPFFLKKWSESDIRDVLKDFGELRGESSKKNDSDQENLSDNDLWGSQMVSGSSGNAPARDTDELPPRQGLLESLSVILSPDEALPDHVILVNTGEWQGQLLAQILENTPYKVICTCSAADVRATVSHLVTKIEKFCINNPKTPTPIKMIVAGGDRYVNSVLRPYVELFSLKSPDWQHYIRFLVIPLGKSLIAKYIGSADAIYYGLFMEDPWIDAFDTEENARVDVGEILDRISKYISGATSILHIPIGEVMITYKDKSSDEESVQNFVPFINEVRIGQIDVCGTSSSVDLDDDELTPPGNLSCSPPISSLLDKVRDTQQTPPSSPNQNSTDPAFSSSVVATATATGPQQKFMDLQLDYWTVSPKDDSSENEKSGNRNSLNTAFKCVSVHRLPLRAQSSESVASSLFMVAITKRKRKGQYPFSVMRLAGKKSKDVESKSHIQEEISRLICTSKNQNSLLTVTVDGVEWADVKFFQLSAQWHTHIRQFPVAVFNGLGDLT